MGKTKLTKFLETPLVPEEVKTRIQAHFNKKLEQYQIIDTFYASSEPRENYLFMVYAYNRITKTFAAWTSWNDSTERLSEGYFGMSTRRDALQVLCDNYRGGELVTKN